MLKGSCACGRVRYEISGELIGPLTHCHCWRCRKHSGSSFGTTAGVHAEDFRITLSEALLSSWESSPGVFRHFASCCGSPLVKEAKEAPDELGFRLGTLDSDPGQKVSQHYMAESAVPWISLDDGLEQVSGGDGPFPGGSTV